MLTIHAIPIRDVLESFELSTATDNLIFVVFLSPVRRMYGYQVNSYTTITFIINLFILYIKTRLICISSYRACSQFHFLHRWHQSSNVLDASFDNMCTLHTYTTYYIHHSVCCLCVCALRRCLSLGKVHTTVAAEFPIYFPLVRANCS